MSQAIPRLFVFRLHWTICSNSLWKYFSRFGTVKQAEVKFDFNSGRSRGIAHVRMGSREAVEKILSQRNHMIEGYEASVIIDRESPTARWQRSTDGKQSDGKQSDGNVIASPEISSETGFAEKTPDISSELESH